MSYEDLTEEYLSSYEAYDGHEQIRKCELEGGRTAFIAVHNTNLGPALGGLRMRAYATERDAVHDVLRLSKGMTYKNAMAGLPLGGGKAVIIGNPREDKTEDLMISMGAAVESLDGKYVTAEDSGSGEEDMVAISESTDHVTGLPPEILAGKGFGELGGNPSPVTALGCYRGLQAAAQFKYGSDDLSGMHVAVQGVGAVGLELCNLLKQDGVKLTVADIDDLSLKQAKDELGKVEIVRPDEIYEVEANIFAPCAMGGILNDKTIPNLRCEIVAGAANNQLQKEYHDQMLADQNILYVPDYVINAGGVICVGYEYFRKSAYNPMDFDITRERMIAHVESIGRNVIESLVYAREHHLNPGEAADRLAEEKFLSGEGLETSTPEEPPSFGTGGGKTLVQ